MANISAQLRSKLEHDPKATVRVIIQLKDEPTKHTRDLQTRGVAVRHVYSLTPSLAVEGPASALLEFAEESWVESIEEDKTVHTM